MPAMLAARNNSSSQESSGIFFVAHLPIDGSGAAFRAVGAGRGSATESPSLLLHRQLADAPLPLQLRQRAEN